MSDEARSGNPPAAAGQFDLARLIETHQAGVWRYLRALGCDRDLADDITQETFLAVYQKPFDDYDPRATAGYLRRVAHNLFISIMRRSGRMIVVDQVEQLDSAWTRWLGDDSTGEELLEKLRQCLEGLTERARWALEMRFRDRLPRLEIAAQLGITEHGAKNLMQRAKHQLKQCIEAKTN
ncbi:MAG: sigma-70 family RNA polymerase sigma factor [Planctomycetales bacterium]|nr:sigma-70 family RNA polymerase sigma factor [Planctomycetales bacterium]